MDNRGRPGYEYRYRISTDIDKKISDDVILANQIYLSEGVIIFAIEIKTNFILKTTNNNTNDHVLLDQDEIQIGFESYVSYTLEQVEEWYLQLMMETRLKEYWMPDFDVQNLVHEAFVLAKNVELSLSSTSDSQGRVIPLIVDVDVLTVQEVGEQFGDAMDRAIWAEHLIPLDLCYCGDDIEIDIDLGDFLLKLARNRVEDVDQGLSLMEKCPICLRKPTIGAQISFVLACNHAFHSSCILGWLRKNNSCPTCRVKAHSFPIN